MTSHEVTSLSKGVISQGAGKKNHVTGSYIVRRGGDIMGI